MSEFAERLYRLRVECLRCWAIEFSDLFPQSVNRKLAEEELKKHGNPDHTCKPKPQFNIRYEDL